MSCPRLGWSPLCLCPAGSPQCGTSAPGPSREGPSPSLSQDMWGNFGWGAPLGRKGLARGPRVQCLPGRWWPLQALARAVQGLWQSLASLNSSVLTHLLLLGAPPAADPGDAAGGAHHVHHLQGDGGGQPLLHHHGVPLLQARLVPPGLHPCRRPFPLPARRDTMCPERRPAHTGSFLCLHPAGRVPSVARVPQGPAGKGRAPASAQT